MPDPTVIATTTTCPGCEGSGTRPMREVLLADLAKVIPNSDGVLWEAVDGETGERQPITFDDVVRTFERHGWRRPAPEQEAACGARYEPNPTMVPCALSTGHEGQHVSSTGCAGSVFRWDQETEQEAVSDEAVEAAARQRWRNDHGSINSPDGSRTPESDERERDEIGFGDWDHGIVAESVKDGYRRKARTELTAAQPHLTCSPEPVVSDEVTGVLERWDLAADVLPRLRGVALEAIVWELLDLTMDVADRAPSPEAVNGARSDAEVVLRSLTRSPAEVESEMRDEWTAAKEREAEDAALAFEVAEKTRERVAAEIEAAIERYVAVARDVSGGGFNVVTRIKVNAMNEAVTIVRSIGGETGGAS